MELTKFKICPNPQCRVHNPPNLIECRKCETDLTGVKLIDTLAEQAEGGEAIPAPPGENAELMRVCECGAKNPPQARKCSACGEDISDVLPTPVESTEPKPFSYELSSVDGSFSAKIDKPLIVVGRECEFGEYLREKVYVARQQARFSVVAGKVFVENLSRTNKTYLNNEALPDGTPTALSDGDEIGLGGMVIEGGRQDLAAYLVFRAKQ